MLRTTTVSVVAVFTLCFAVTSVSAQTRTLSGTWTHGGASAEQSRRFTAIDRATDGMNFMIRGRARDRLRQATTPAPRFTLNDQGNRVTLNGPHGQVTLVVGGPAVRVSGERGQGMIQASRQNGYLVVNMRADGGSRRTRYSVSTDGRTLYLDVRVTNERLSHPLQYRVSYTRG